METNKPEPLLTNEHWGRSLVLFAMGVWCFVWGSKHGRRFFLLFGGCSGCLELEREPYIRKVDSTAVIVYDNSKIRCICCK